MLNKLLGMIIIRAQKKGGLKMKVSQNKLLKTHVEKMSVFGLVNKL
jgi:hypothetical protein